MKLGFQLLWESSQFFKRWFNCFANTENTPGPRTLSYQPPESQINKKKRVIYMWNPENNTNECIRKIETDS